MLSLLPLLTPNGSRRKDAMPESSSRSGGSFAGGIPTSMLAELLRHVSACVGVYDLAGNCLLASEALAQWLDRPLAELPGRNLDQLWPDDFATVLRNRQRLALAEG